MVGKNPTLITKKNKQDVVLLIFEWIKNQSLGRI